MSTADPMPSLSAYMAEALSHPLPDPVSLKTRHHLLDTLAAMVSGSRLRPGQVAIPFFASQGGPAEAVIAGTRIRTSAINAAWANGMLAHADETDDSHAPSLSHPGCAVVPAALAVAERQGASGDALLGAIALGYDVGTRMTQALTIRGFYVEGHKSTHSVAGLFAATAAAAALHGLPAPAMRWVLSYAAQQSSGVACWQRDPDHIEKAFVFGGMPARNGVSAAAMVAAGFTGVDNVFTGPDNYFAAYGPAGDPGLLAEGLGTRFEIMRASIKKWSVGSPVQAPLDAVMALLAEGIHRRQIARLTVHVGTREAKVVDNRAMPEVCLQHLLAVLLVEGSLSFAATHDLARMSDPQVQHERAKIDLVLDDELERDLPKRRTIVRATLFDGTMREWRVDAVRGTPDNPMNGDEIRAKATDLMAPVLGSERARGVCKAVAELSDAASVRTLAQALTADP